MSCSATTEFCTISSSISLGLFLCSECVPCSSSTHCAPGQKAAVPIYEVSVRSGPDSNCCDRKARAACAQCFALWQQATIEIMHRNHSSRTLVILFDRSQASIGRDSTPQSLYYCLFAPHVYGVILRAHPGIMQPMRSALALISHSRQNKCIFSDKVNYCRTQS